MRRNTSGTLTLIVAALLALPAAAGAQQEQAHRHGQDRQAEDRDMSGMMMKMDRHGQMMDTMGMTGTMARPNPMMVLRHQKALGLTEEQVGKLEALRERMARSRTEHMKPMRAIQDRLAEQAEDPSLDLDAYESTLRSLADEQVAMHVRMARLGQEARGVLTPEQREQLRVGMEFMRGTMMEMMHGQMGRMSSGDGTGTMMDRMCPMMRGDSGEGH